MDKRHNRKKCSSWVSVLDKRFCMDVMQEDAKYAYFDIMDLENIYFGIRL